MAVILVHSVHTVVQDHKGGNFTHKKSSCGLCAVSLFSGFLTCCWEVLPFEKIGWRCLIAGALQGHNLDLGNCNPLLLVANDKEVLAFLALRGLSKERGEREGEREREKTTRQ